MPSGLLVLAEALKIVGFVAGGSPRPLSVTNLTTPCLLVMIKQGAQGFCGKANSCKVPRKSCTPRQTSHSRSRPPFPA